MAGRHPALTYTLTIRKFMPGADRRMSPTFNCACLAASMASLCGWGRIPCNLTPAKLTCSGVSLHVDNLSCRVFHLDFISPSSSVRNLGIFLDADLTMRTRVQWTAAGGFIAALRKVASCAVFGARSRRLFARH